MEYSFSQEELQEIERHIAKYPGEKTSKKSAVMPALWIAQEKFGWLSNEAIKLVATSLGLPYAHVYGVASFYTMYFKKEVPKHLIEICTCFSCGELKGQELLDYTKDHLGCDAQGFSKDGKIWARAAECLGACDTGPVCQISNRRYRHKLTEEKLQGIIEKLQNDEELPFERIPLYDQTTFDD